MLLIQSILRWESLLLISTHSGTATLNTDFKVFLSADNGSNFTQVTLYDLELYELELREETKTNDVTISNTGTQLKWKVEFANQASDKFKKQESLVYSSIHK